MQKMEDQGFNETHTKGGYNDWVDRLLESERRMAFLAEVGSYRLLANLLWTTVSGK